MRAARRAAAVGPWPRRGIADRARILRELGFDRAAEALSHAGGSALRDGDRLDYAIRVPLGVVALLGHEHVGPALAAGNAVVVACDAPEAERLAELIDGTELPSGTFNLVRGAAAELAAHPGVDLVRTPAAGPTPVILFEDADPAAAIAFGTRLLVQRGLYDRVCEIAPVRARNMTERVPATQPLPAADHILSGGVEDGRLKPTVIDGVDVELDGPVIAILPFDTEDEAVALARAGERVSLWTNDLARAHRMARALGAEHCWINAHAEAAEDGLDRYSRLATVHL